MMPEDNVVMMMIIIKSLAYQCFIQISSNANHVTTMLRLVLTSFLSPHCEQDREEERGELLRVVLVEVKEEEEEEIYLAGMVAMVMVDGEMKRWL